MNPIDDDTLDPEDEKNQPARGEPDLGRIFQWGGKPLAAFSYNYRCAMNRLTFGTEALSAYEHDFLFLFLLQQKPATVDQIRSAAQVSDFRIKCGEWVEKERLASRWAEVNGLVSEIQQAVEDADNIYPALPKGEKSAPAGNV